MKKLTPIEDCDLWMKCCRDSDIKSFTNYENCPKSVDLDMLIREQHNRIQKMYEEWDKLFGWLVDQGLVRPRKKVLTRPDSILLSIKPIYWERIVSGEKKHEYRRRLGPWAVEKIYFYATSPVSKVVGYAECEGVFRSDPDGLWAWTHKESGISEEDFYAYFDGCDMGKCGAYELGKVVVFEKPKELSEFGLKHAPQSFAYIKETVL